VTEATPEYLRECLDYNPASGEIRWRVRPRGHFKTDARWRQFNTRFAGKIAGAAWDGYRKISIDGRLNYAHRIIWAMQTDAWPIDDIDHINRNRSDNVWSNLRAATRQQNIWNSGIKAGRDLPMGVQPKRGRYSARCVHNGKPTHLGTFDTPEAAGAAYLAFARSCREEFT
jgi:hypothetical protein